MHESRHRKGWKKAERGRGGAQRGVIRRKQARAPLMRGAPIRKRKARISTWPTYERGRPRIAKLDSGFHDPTEQRGELCQPPLGHMQIHNRPHISTREPSCNFKGIPLRGVTSRRSIRDSTRSAVRSRWFVSMGHFVDNGPSPSRIRLENEGKGQRYCASERVFILSVHNSGKKFPHWLRYD